MNIAGEIHALRSEQRRLRDALDLLDGRITVVERWNAPHVEEEPPISDPPTAPPPPPLPAAVPAVVPPTPSALRAATERRRPESLEVALGQVWLVRIGIVILLTGLVFLGNYAYQEFVGRLGPAGKLSLLALAGLGLAVAGGRIARRHLTLRSYGRVLVAGGCATLYYAAFAAHFVAGLRVIESPLLGGVLLLALGGAFAFWADRRKSQLLAGATVALSLYTAAINAVGAFALFSNVVISAVALVLLARHRWTGLSFVSLLGSYGAFAFWRFQQTHSLLPAADPATFWPGLIFPLTYWALHTAATFVRNPRGMDAASRPFFLTLNNGAFYALAGGTIWIHAPGTFWIATLGFGFALIGLSRLAAHRSPEEVAFDGTHLAQGLGLLVLGLLAKFSGWQLAISLAGLSATLVALGRHRHGSLLRFFAGVGALLAFGVALHGCLTEAPFARWTAAGVSFVLAGIVVTLKRQTGDAALDWRALGFATLSAALVPFVTWQENLAVAAVGPLGIAFAAAASRRIPRLGGEFATIASPLALVAQGEFVAHYLAGHPVAAALAAITALSFIALGQTRLRALPGRLAGQSLHFATAAALAIAWIFDALPAENRAPTLAVIALALLATGIAARTPVLAVGSLSLTLVALPTLTSAVIEKTAWLPAAIATALLLAQSPVLARSALSKTAADTLRAAIRGLGLLLGVGLVFAHVPAVAWFPVLSVAAFVFFVAATRNRSRETLAHAGALVIVSVGVIFHRLAVAPATPLDLIGYLALALAGQALRPSTLPAPAKNLPAVLAGLATLGGWLLLHRLVSAHAEGFLLTISWSLFAFATIAAGFLLRDRTYRWVGLLVLTASLGRILVIDVWQLDTLLRILSFLVLGAVLLALGFLYNRHAERIRRWL